MEGGGGGHQVRIVHNELATDLIYRSPIFSVSMTTHSSEERLRRTSRGSTTLSNCSLQLSSNTYSPAYTERTVVSVSQRIWSLCLSSVVCSFEHRTPEKGLSQYGVCVHVCACVCTCVHVCACACVCMCMNVCACSTVCIYIYTYTVSAT